MAEPRALLNYKMTSHFCIMYTHTLWNTAHCSRSTYIGAVMTHYSDGGKENRLVPVEVCLTYKMEKSCRGQQQISALTSYSSKQTLVCTGGHRNINFLFELTLIYKCFITSIYWPVFLYSCFT